MKSALINKKGFVKISLTIALIILAGIAGVLAMTLLQIQTAGLRSTITPQRISSSNALLEDGTATSAARSIELTLQDLWLKGSPCRPPCWWNITPGKTTLAEAAKLLENNDLVSGFSIYEDSIRPSSGEIDWTWRDHKKSGGRLFYAPSGASSEGIVYVIHPALACCIRLNEIIQAYGEPSHARVREVRFFEFPKPDEKVFTFTLIWVDQGFSIRGAPTNQGYIGEDFLMLSVAFFVPSMEGYLAAEGEAGRNALPWHGYDQGDVYLAP